MNAAEHDVILRLSDTEIFHAQAGIAQPTANERRVEHQRFHKTVPSTAQHPIILRLAHRTGRIRTGIDEHECVIPLPPQRQHTAEHRMHTGIHIGAQLHFDIRKQPLLQLPHGRIVRITAPQQKLHHLLHDLILDEPIDKVKEIRPVLRLQHPAYQIKARIDGQRFLQPLSQFLHLITVYSMHTSAYGKQKTQQDETAESDVTPDVHCTIPMFPSNDRSPHGAHRCVHPVHSSS